METFSALLATCARNSPVIGEFTAQRLVTRSFDVFVDLRLNNRLSKQWWGWWFVTQSRPLLRHCNVTPFPWRYHMDKEWWQTCIWHIIHILCHYVLSLLDNSVNPDSKVHGANMGPTWVLSAPDGLHVGPANLAIRELCAGLHGVYWVMKFRWH